MEKKLTKREVINAMLTIDAITSNETFVGFLNHELELLDKKSSNRKETSKQKENKEFTDIVYSILTANGDKAMSIKEIVASDTSLDGLSSNRVSAMLKTLVDGGLVKRDRTSKGTFYTVVSEC